MPELPEVETIAADLRPHLVNRTILRCELRFPSIVRFPEPESFVYSITGARIQAVKRRGKFILMPLEHGGVSGRSARPGALRGEFPPQKDVPPQTDRLLVVHLGMTGQLLLVHPETPIPIHTHAIFELDDGRELRYRDPRRFGRLLAGTEAELIAARALPHLGPEPIDPAFGAGDLYQRLRRRRASLKAVLLDQSTIAGVGNIYADESLHRARLRPDRAAGGLSRRSVARLHESLREALQLAIRNRGSSVDTYRDAWGETGLQQEELHVYGRGGEPCLNCGRPLSVIRIAGRSSVFCRRCQR